MRRRGLFLSLPASQPSQPRSRRLSLSPRNPSANTLSAIGGASEIGVLTPYLWIAQGATINVPITARVLNNGAPATNGNVTFTVLKGSGTLSAATGPTNSTGYATTTLAVSQFSSLVQMTACVAPDRKSTRLNSSHRR